MYVPQVRARSLVRRRCSMGPRSRSLRTPAPPGWHARPSCSYSTKRCAHCNPKKQDFPLARLEWRTTHVDTVGTKHFHSWAAEECTYGGLPAVWNGMHYYIPLRSDTHSSRRGVLPLFVATGSLEIRIITPRNSIHQGHNLIALYLNNPIRVHQLQIIITSAYQFYKTTN